MLYRFLIQLLFCLFTLTVSQAVKSQTKLNVAVASNFKLSLQKLITHYKQSSNTEINIITASTGKLYSQILHGAPYDLLLAADRQSIKKLQQQGLVQNSTTYAIGQLQYCQLKPFSQTQWHNQLQESDSKIAIANPAIAPYGLAAKQSLQQLKLWTAIKPKLVFGENISQTMQFLLSGHVSAAFIASSLAQEWQLKQQNPKIFCQQLATNLHDPIQQNMALLKTNKPSQQAQHFFTYIQSQAAKTIMQQSGYQVP